VKRAGTAMQATRPAAPAGNSLRAVAGASARRGFVLLPVVLLLALIGVVAFMINNESALEVDAAGATGAAGESAQAEYVARAGLQHALQQVAASGCGPYSDLSATPFGSDSYTATVTIDNGGGSISTVIVPVSDDAWIEQQNASANHGGDDTLRLEGSQLDGNYKWPYYRFDLESAGIPADAAVVSAVAHLYVITFNHTDAVTVHQVTTAWDEASVTWDSISSSIDPSSIAVLPEGTPQDQFVDINLTSQVQSWISGSEPNYGMLIMPSTLTGSETSRFTSKEYATVAKRPYLEVRYTDGALVNRTAITATGVLTGGSTYTFTRREIPLYQPQSTIVLQPGTAGGRDTWVDSSQATWNYGAHSGLNVESGRNGLIRFSNEVLPPAVRVDSATLSLYIQTLNSAGTVSLHSMSRSWIEGSCNGSSSCPADGANWNTSDGSQAWTAPGGDYSASPLASQTIGAPNSWYEWDVTDTVAAWIDGSLSNDGLLLKAGDGFRGTFASSDANDATLHPRLTITFSCECGVTCELPAGSGKVLMVVGNDASLAAADAKKKDLFEAWGYTVSLIDDNASQTGFEAALSSNDVAYVSYSADDSNLAGKLATTPRAVINEQPDQVDNLGLAGAGGEGVGANLEITDNIHFITAPFPLGLIPISRAPMEGQIVGGSPAAGLQVLGKLNGSAGLAFIEAGGALAGGGLAPGRRVMVPVGRSDKFNWDYLNNNGRLIVQRAIQWGVDAVPAVSPKKVYWTDDIADRIQRSDEDGSHVEDVITGLDRPTGLDIDTVNGKLYWTNNYQIRRADLDGSNSDVIYTDSSVTFDIKLDVDGGKMYWTHDNGSSRIMSANLDGSGATLINNSLDRPSYLSLDKANSQMYLTEFGSGRVSRMKYNGTSVTTLQSGPTGSVGSALDLVHGKMFWTGGASNDWIKRANLDGSSVETIVTGLNAPQDIAYDADNDRIYWVDALNKLVQRANPDGSNVETVVSSGLTRPRGIVLVDADQVPATGGSGGGPGGSGCDGTFRDEFNALSYAGNDGTLSWSGDWQEVNETDGPQRGDEQVAPDPTALLPPGTNQMRVRDNDGGGEGVLRELDLSGAGTATLSLFYRRYSLDNSYDYVSVQISSNGAAGPWTEITRVQGPGTDLYYQPITLDISAYISATAAIRLISSPYQGGLDDVWFDNVQIQCTP